jgi:hypothetical protein
MKALFIICIFFTSCMSSLSERRKKFERYLESFVGKTERAVVIEFGHPDEYLNGQESDVTKEGTYMIYRDKFANTYCEIRFKISERADKILEWDYQGNGCY